MTPPEATSTMTFGQLEIAYDDRVLRPRPWTVRQSIWAAELIAHGPDGPILELCTGAGQIGLLTTALVRRPLVAVDADPTAVAFARKNAAQAGLADLVDVREGPVDTSVGLEERFALVIADPPWVRGTDVGRYPEDPLLAIDGGDDGLDVARLCVTTAAQHLVDGGSVVLQLGTPEQADALGVWLEPRGGLVVTEVRAYDGEGTLVRLEPTARVGH